MPNAIVNTSGQNFLYAQEYRINRPDPTSTTDEREDVDVTPLMTGLNVISIDLDPTVGTVATIFNLPTTAWVVGSTLEVTVDFAGGTDVQIGANSNPDSLFTSAQITTPSAGALLGLGVDVGAIAVGGDYDVTVNGTYTAGAAVLKVLWLDTRKTTDDPVGDIGGSETVTIGLQDSLGDSSEAGTVS